MCPKTKNEKHDDYILTLDMHVEEIHVIKSDKLLEKQVSSWGLQPKYKDEGQSSWT